MKFKYTKAFAAFAFLALSTSCADDKWEAGPDVAPDCMTVYFEPMSSYDLIIEPDDSRQIPVTIGRAQMDKAATIALDVTAPEGVVVPQSIDFEAGEQSKTIFIDLKNMPSKTSGIVSLALPEQMTSPYGAGNASIDLKVTVSGAWVALADDVIVTFGSKYPQMDASLYLLEGTNNFKMPDFLGSGIDFVFTVTNPGSGNLPITPIKNYMDVKELWEDYDYDGWVLYDQENDTFPEWSPDGSYPFISILEFDPYYADINVAEGTIYFSPYFRFADDSGSYINIYVYFTPKFDPFAEGAE